MYELEKLIRILWLNVINVLNVVVCLFEIKTCVCTVATPCTVWVETELAGRMLAGWMPCIDEGRMLSGLWAILACFPDCCCMSITRGFPAAAAICWTPWICCWVAAIAVVSHKSKMKNLNKSCILTRRKRKKCYSWKTNHYEPELAEDFV